MILTQAGQWVGLGLAIGLAGAIASAVIAFAALGAAWLPARSAVQVDPAKALRA